MKRLKSNKPTAAGRRRNKKGSLGFESLEDRKMMASVTSGPTAIDLSHTAETVQTQTSQQAAEPVVQRIVNGQQTNGFKAVGYVGPLGCTGTLISPTHVLTAAHCLPGVGNGQATFVVNGQTYQSSKVTIHPDYNDNNFGRGDDIAIITLSRPVTGVTPMEINRTTPQIGTMLTLVGFGEGGTSTGGFDPNDDGKQVGQTRLEGVTAEHITWNFDSHNEANTAPGDSGGPAFINVGGKQVIAGVTSGGTGDAHQLGDESFDTRVDVHAAWIDSIVGNSGGGGPVDDHVNSPGANATKVNLNAAGNGVVNGKLEVGNDRDAFQFTVAKPGVTTIRLTETGGDVRAFLRIYNSAGRFMKGVNTFSGADTAQLKITLPAGKYFVMTGARNANGTGDYRLNFSHKANAPGGGVTGSKVFANNQTMPIRSNGQHRVISNINVSGMSGTLTDVNVKLDIDHTYTSDLRLILIAPDNTRVTLANRIGDDGNNFDRTTFDQQAGQYIRQADAPFRGTFKPMHNLNRLLGKNPNGRWRLIVQDFENLDGGRLNNWSIQLTTSQANGRVAKDDTRSNKSLRKQVQQRVPSAAVQTANFQSEPSDQLGQSGRLNSRRVAPAIAGTSWGPAFGDSAATNSSNLETAALAERQSSAGDEQRESDHFSGRSCDQVFADFGQDLLI